MNLRPPDSFRQNHRIVEMTRIQATTIEITIFDRFWNYKFSFVILGCFLPSIDNLCATNVLQNHNNPVYSFYLVAHWSLGYLCDNKWTRKILQERRVSLYVVSLKKQYESICTPQKKQAF